MIRLFGYVLIKEERLFELEECEDVRDRVRLAHGWFEGWKDLNQIWDYLLHGSRPIDQTRIGYALARKTNERGEPTFE